MDSVAAVNWEAYEQEATAAIGAALSDAELDEARVRFLGRKSELAQALRGVRDRESGMLLNGIRAKLEAAVEARVTALQRLAFEAAAGERRRRDDPRHAGGARSPAPADTDHPRDRRHLPRHGLRGLGRQRGRDRLGELRRADERPRPSVAVDQRHFLPRRRHRPAHAHVSRTRSAPCSSRTPPLYMVSPGRCYRRDTPDATHSPIFLQVECLAVDRGITLADLQGTVLQFFRALFGAEREVRMRTQLLPVHRAVRRVRRHLFHLRRPRLRDLQALGLDRDGRRRLGRP